MSRLAGRIAEWLERGIWGVRFGQHDISVKAPWSRVITDIYIIRRSRSYRFGGWQLVLKLTRR